MKYISLDVKLAEDTYKRLFCIFSEDLVHADVADHLKMLCARSLKSKSVVASAGFVDLDVKAVHGKSESLKNLQHQPIDRLLMESGSSCSVHMGNPAEQYKFLGPMLEKQKKNKSIKLSKDQLWKTLDFMDRHQVDNIELFQDNGVLSVRDGEHTVTMSLED